MLMLFTAIGSSWYAAHNDFRFRVWEVAGKYRVSYTRIPALGPLTSIGIVGNYKRRDNAFRAARRLVFGRERKA